MRWLIVMVSVLGLVACSGARSSEPDAGIAAECDRCTDDQLCVATCGGFGDVFTTRCVTGTTCTGVCSQECEEELCTDGFRCQYGCNNIPSEVFACAGP